ncbi:MAG: hypothetical protein WBR18_13280 [Anaerolineales bacterium]
MKRQFSLLASFEAVLFGLVVSYLICIAGDLLFGWTMYEVWAPLLPGFTWPLTLGAFSVGLLWLVLYAAYITAVLLLPYRYFTRTRGSTA